MNDFCEAIERYAALLRQDTITIYPPANDWPFDPDNISEMWRQREEAKRQAQQQEHEPTERHTRQA
jgi:ADP-heptose:LPS heptosyltransferase